MELVREKKIKLDYDIVTYNLVDIISKDALRIVFETFNPVEMATMLYSNMVQMDNDPINMSSCGISSQEAPDEERRTLVTIKRS